VASSWAGFRQRPAFFWLVVGLGLLQLGFYAFAAVLLVRNGMPDPVFGWDYAEGPRGAMVVSVDPAGTAAGALQPGDLVLALDGDARVQRVPLYFALRFVPPNGEYVLRVARGGEEYEYRLRASVAVDPAKAIDHLGFLVISFGFFGLALTVGLLKPASARLPCLAAFAVSLYFLEASLRPSLWFSTGPVYLGYVAIAASQPLHFALVYHFFYRFPDGAPKGRAWSLLQVLFYAWAVLLMPRRPWIGVLLYRGREAVMANLFAHRELFDLVLVALQGLVVTALLATCAVIARNYRRVRQPDQRRRTRWIAASSAVALLPWAVVGPDLFVLPASAYLPVTLATNLLILLIPVSFGYAILKHRVFDINVVIRRGLQYLLARNVLRAVLSVPLALLAVTVLAQPQRTVAEVLAQESVYLYATAVVVISLHFRERLAEGLDRRFFREAYQQERVLVALIEEVKKKESLSEVSALVSQRLGAALHPKAIHVFYRESPRRDLTLGHSSSGAARGLRLPRGWRLLQLVEAGPEVLDYPLAPAELPEEEARLLAELAVSLIVPLSATDGELIGLMLLGEKKSEEPYSLRDRRLLKALAEQVALVYEMVELREEVGKERRVKREVLARLEGRDLRLMRECPLCGRCFDGGEQACPDDLQELSPTLPIERVVEGKYRLDRLLGRGGMGAVYEAQDLRLARRVAIKVLAASLFREDVALRRFEREARASARLSHPNVVTVFDYGTLATGGAYLVMERLDGVTLRAELVRGPIAPATAAEWFDQVLEGVGAAHQAGIVHRDLKPENVLIAASDGRRPVVKVLDFGLAKLKVPDEGTSLTVPGTVMGTIRYMSPEQVSMRDVDERSDVFSLGVMAAEALSGRHPFEGATPTQVVLAILNTPYRFPGESPEARALDRVLQKCLAKDPEGRFGTVAALQQELIPAIRRWPGGIGPGETRPGLPTAEYGD
jgi:GAF domain-containing protein